jgi:hypothetical protein
MCQVSFAEPFLLSSAREMKVASTGLSRDVPAGTCGFSARCAAALSLGGGALISAWSVEHAGGSAARHARRRASSWRQRIRIILVVVAALAAVLLAHCRIISGTGGPSASHPSGKRHGLVVGAPSSSSVASADLNAGYQRVPGQTMQCVAVRAAKKPLSQPRCSAVNGALSGTMEASGGRMGVARSPRTCPSRWNFVAACERWKLAGRTAARQIGLSMRSMVVGASSADVAIKLAGKWHPARSAADQDVIALDGVAVSEACTLSEQPDVADVMLRAG